MCMVVGPGGILLAVMMEEKIRNDDHNGPKLDTAGDDDIGRYRIDDKGGPDWIMLATEKDESIGSGGWSGFG